MAAAEMYYLMARHLRHLDVQEDQIRKVLPRFQQIQSLDTVHGRGDQKTQGDKEIFDD